MTSEPLRLASRSLGATWAPKVNISAAQARPKPFVDPGAGHEIALERPVTTTLKPFNDHRDMVPLISYASHAQEAYVLESAH